jgi:hypothetical protein
MLRPLFLTGSADDSEFLYTITVDSPKGDPLMGLIANDIDVRLIAWPDGEQAVQIGRLAYPEPATPEGPNVFRMLDASTAHLPQELREELNEQPGVVADERGYGWLLWVPTNIDEHIAEYEYGEPMTPPDDPNYAEVHYAEAQERDLNAVPAAVVALWRKAAEFDCQYVLLDSDARLLDLPTYD